MTANNCTLNISGHERRQRGSSSLVFHTWYC